MRRLLTWAVVSLGIAALARRLRRRSSGPEEARPEETLAPAGAPPEGGPADELRRKLAESRAEEAEEPEPPVSAPTTVEERRAEVHDAGRATIDEMREPDEA